MSDWLQKVFKANKKEPTDWRVVTGMKPDYINRSFPARQNYKPTGEFNDNY